MYQIFSQASRPMKDTYKGQRVYFVEGENIGVLGELMFKKFEDAEEVKKVLDVLGDAGYTLVRNTEEG